MDSLKVRQLEEQISAAITGVIKSHFLPGQPVTARTTHLMAKAAVAVLEAVQEKPGPNTPRSDGLE
jgi:hypothetical protein